MSVSTLQRVEVRASPLALLCLGHGYKGSRDPSRISPREEMAALVFKGSRSPCQLPNSAGEEASSLGP